MSLPHVNRALVAALVVVLGAIVATLVLRAGDDDGDDTAERTPAQARAAALSYADPRAGVLATVDTATDDGPARTTLGVLGRFAGAPFALAELERRLLGDDGPRIGELRPAFGAPVVLTAPNLRAARGGDAFAVVPALDQDAAREATDRLVDDRRAVERLTHRGAQLYDVVDGGALARDGSTLVFGPDEPRVKQAIDRERTGAGLGAAAADRRLAGPDARGAVVRAAIAPAALGLTEPVANVPVVSGLRNVALALVPTDDGFALRATLAIPGVPASEVPLAPGPEPPRPRAGRAGSASPIVLAVRDAGATINVLREHADELDPERWDVFKQVDGVLERFAGLDLDDLLEEEAATATLTTRDGRNGIARVELRDPGRVRDELDGLGRIATASSIAGFLGGDLGGYAVDERDGRYVVALDDRLVADLGVTDDVLVAANVAGVDAKRIVRAPATTPPAKGALYAEVDGAFLRARILNEIGDVPPIARRLLDPLGDLTFTARAEPGRLDLEATLAIRG